MFSNHNTFLCVELVVTPLSKLRTLERMRFASVRFLIFNSTRNSRRGSHLQATGGTVAREGVEGYRGISPFPFLTTPHLKNANNIHI